MKNKNIVSGFRHSKTETLASSLLKITNIEPTAEIYKFLTGGKEVASLTRAQLLNRALHIASELQKHSVKGERVLLLLPSSLEYATSFMGCILAGAIAVPAYTPSKRRNGDRIKNIYNDCKPKIIISLSKFSLTSVELMGNDDVNILSLCQIINIDKIENNTTPNYQEVEICENDIAFLQYTSGSTAKPKGVMVTHKNLIHNIKLLAKIYNLNSKDITVSWLPIYHDMGLIIGILKSIYLGDRSILMPTEDFIKSPLIWLKTISKYRATCSAAPNFAYNLCLLKKISSQDAKTLDLSSWKTALNAAEPIQPQILLEFTNKFSQYGYKQTTNTPSYGMAEATLFISACGYGKKETITYFDKHLLEYEQKAVKAKKSDKAKPLVSCGKAELMAKLLIVNPDTLTKCSEGQVGEIWVKDTSVAQGYWQKPEVTNNIFHAFEKSTNEGPFLRSGDLGFFYEEELYIASRKKDILIINGQNIYPQDIELLVEKSDIRIRKNTAAAFTIEMHGTERIVIIQEGNFTDIIAKELFSKITTNIRNEYQLAPYDIVFIKKGTFNKTSSGKIQRQLSRKLYLEDRLEIIASLQSLIKKNRAKSQYPKTTLEKYLAKLWQENLTLEPNYQISLSDNFFYLGGNSISANNIILAIKDKLHKNLSLKELFNHHTIKDLANYIEKLNSSNDHSLYKLNQGQDLLVTQNQDGLYFLHKSGYNTEYNISVLFKWNADLDHKILKKAFCILVKKHKVFRTSFHHNDIKLTPIILDFQKLNIEFSVSDFSKTDYHIAKNRAEDYIKEDNRKTFNLANAPLIRGQIIKLQQHEYYIYFNLHHIIADGVSINIITNELSKIYNALLNKEKINLDDQKIEFLDYASWHNSYSKTLTYKKQLKYWLTQLDNMPANIQISNNYKNANSCDNVAQNIEFIISEELHHKIKIKAQNLGTSTFILIMSSLYILLRKYSNQQDLVIGTPVQNRNKSAFKEVIGFFANILPIRIKGKKCDKILDILEYVKNNILAAMENHEVSLAEIAKSLKIPRNLSTSPFFNICLSYQNFTRPQLKLGNIKTNIMQINNHKALYDLTITVSEHNDANDLFTFSFNYKKSLFDKDYISLIYKNLCNILTLICDNDNLAISNIVIDKNQSSNTKIKSFSEEKYLPYHEIKTIDSIFDQITLKNSDHIAIKHGNKKITYAKLAKKANNLATYLQKNFEQEKFIAIYMDRSINMIIAILGILKSGKAYVPINLLLPEDKIRYIVSDTKLNVILSEEKLTDQIAQICSQQKIIKLNDNILNYNNDDSITLNTQNIENIAYIIYTSGSTGNPKGVIVKHYNIARICYKTNYINLDSSDNVLQLANYAFDGSIFDIFISLCNGATLTLIDENDITNFAKLSKIITEQKISVSFITTALFNAIIDLNPRVLTGLRKVLFGGEKSSIEHLNKAYKILGPRKIIHVYGPTECCVFSTFYEVNNFCYGNSLPIGKAISGTKLYVLNENYHHVNKGEIGELYISDLAVSGGYLNNKLLTKQNFISLPNLALEKLYKTGDLVKTLDNGNLEFVERVDEQIKLRGYRIEPAEIENTLNKYHSIQDSLVILQNNKQQKRLICFYKAKKSLRNQDINSYARSNLPYYMIPALFIRVSQIPLTINGKKDRKYYETYNLPLKTSTIKTSLINNTEITLKKIWEEVLNISDINLDDNYFHLGGDSIKSMQIITKAKEYNLHISIKDFFKHQTINSLANYVTYSKNISTNRAEQGLLSGLVKLLPIQKSFFAHENINYNLFNQSITIELKQDIKTQKLQNILNHIICKHDSLRLRYKFINNIWEQFYSKNTQVDFVELKIPKNTTASKFKEILSKIEASLNIKNGPVFKCTKINFKGKIYLYFVAHHLVVDTVSWRIILEDFSKLITNQTTEIPTKTSSFREWSNKLSNYAYSEAAQSEIKFWVKQIDRSSETVYATYADTENYNYVFQTDLITKKQQIHKKYNTEINDFLLTAFNIAYATWSGTTSVTIDIESHGREEIFNDINLSNSVGWFTSIFPVRFNIKDSSDYIYSLYETKQTLRSIPNKGIGYGVLKYANQLFKNAPDSMIAFNYLGSFDNLENKHFKLTENFIANHCTKELNFNRKLTINILEQQGKMIFDLTYNKNIFTDEEIKNFTRIYIKALNKLCNKAMICEQKYSDSYKILNIENITDNKTIEDYIIFNQDQQNELFAFPGITGVSSYYHELAQELKDFKIYSFNNYNIFSSRRNKFTEFNELVEYNVKLIKENSASKNLQIIGHSFGAIVAYAAAVKLEEFGYKVRLYLLDQIPKLDNFNLKTGIKYSQILSLINNISAIYKINNLDIQLPFLTKNINLKTNEAMYNMIHQIFIWNKYNINLTEITNLCENLMSNLKLNYELKDMVSNLTVIFAEKSPYFKKKKDYIKSWQKFSANNITELTASGNHYNMLKKPNINNLAIRLKAQFNKKT